MGLRCKKIKQDEFGLSENYPLLSVKEKIIRYFITQIGARYQQNNRCKEYQADNRSCSTPHTKPNLRKLPEKDSPKRP